MRTPAGEPGVALEYLVRAGGARGESAPLPGEGLEVFSAIDQGELDLGRIVRRVGMVKGTIDLVQHVYGLRLSVNAVMSGLLDRTLPIGRHVD